MFQNILKKEKRDKIVLHSHSLVSTTQQVKRGNPGLGVQVDVILPKNLEARLPKLTLKQQFAKTEAFE